MKKRIISLIVAVCCLMSLTVEASDETGQGYSISQMETISSKYDTQEPMIKAVLCNDQSFGYWAIVNKIKEHGFISWAIDKASIAVDQYPDEKKCAEILANLMTMQTGELAEQIAVQGQFDDLETDIDYIEDTIDITLDLVGLSRTKDVLFGLFNDGQESLRDILKENDSLVQYYKIVLADYSQSQGFLKAIADYSENETLRKVAASLVNANDTLLEKRLTYLAEASKNIALDGTEFFLKNLFWDSLKQTDIYSSDDAIKFFVDMSAELKDKVFNMKDAAKAAFKLTMLAGDIGFGTTNVYNRYQEMKVVSEIANALVKASNAVDLPKKISSDRIIAIQQKCYYYQSLVVTHARGEYLVYQLLMNDAGGLSDLRWILEYWRGDENSTKGWYDGQVHMLLNFCNFFEELFEIPEGENKYTEKWAVEPVYSFDTIELLYSKEVENYVDIPAYAVQNDGKWSLWDGKSDELIMKDVFTSKPYLDSWGLLAASDDENRMLEANAEAYNQILKDAGFSFKSTFGHGGRTIGWIRDEKSQQIYHFDQQVGPATYVPIEEYEYSELAGVIQGEWVWQDIDKILQPIDGALFGIADMNGNMVTDFEYTKTAVPSSKLIAVQGSGEEAELWGYCNDEGKLVIPCKYKAQTIENAKTKCPYPEKGGFVVAINKNDEYLVLGLQGEIIVPAGIYEMISPSDVPGYIWAKKDGLWGLLDITQSGGKNSPEMEQTLSDEQLIEIANSQVHEVYSFEYKFTRGAAFEVGDEYIQDSSGKIWSNVIDEKVQNLEDVENIWYQYFSKDYPMPELDCYQMINGKLYAFNPGIGDLLGEEKLTSVQSRDENEVVLQGYWFWETEKTNLIYSMTFEDGKWKCSGLAKG